MNKKLEDLRKEYSLQTITINELDVNPFTQFSVWMNEAIISGVNEPNAMTLATCNKKGNPSARMILLKQHNEKGFTFFTNYESRKAIDIEENPFAALLFYWPELERQVRIEGPIKKTSPEISDEYFIKRPEGSRIGAWVSPQSKSIPNRNYLENLEKDYTKLFQNKPLTRPKNWGGYILIPNRFELWQGRANRLHDRIEYFFENQSWKIHRLAP